MNNQLIRRVEQVSVVIPLYNAKSYITQTIESILQQDFGDFHLYIVDDHSTDGSADIAKTYADKYPDKISYQRGIVRGGRPAVGKNIGIKMSKGEYVAFMDHDDWWDKDHLTLLVAAMEDNPKIGLVGANAVIYDSEQKKSLGNFWQDPKKLKRVDLHLETLFEPPFATSSCMLLRRQALDELGVMDEALWMSDDHEIAMRIVLSHKYLVEALPKTTIYRRWHSQSLSNVKDSISIALGDVEHIYSKFVNRPDISEIERATLRRWYQTVRRRWANYLVAVGDIDQARQIYRTLKLQGEFKLPVAAIRLLLTVWPGLARKIVSAKRAWSFRHPQLR